MITSMRDNNVIDQKHIQNMITSRDVVCLAQPLEKMALSLSADDALLYESEFGTYEVSVAYFRTGYVPEDYSENGWVNRGIIERSKVVKSPSIPAQLAGTKKVQQLMCEDEHLRRFVHDPLERQLLENVFTTQIALPPEGDIEKKHFNDAIQNPEKWIMKPEREGGGNNIFGEKMKYILINSKNEDLKKYILMKKIISNTYPCMSISGNICESIGELGIYSTFLSDSSNNRQVGHIVRTKSATSEEGGIVAGFGCVNTAFQTQDSKSYSKSYKLKKLIH
eukprot:GHVL01021144.1.p1 GENE.GHVL01021144.1~~GHVL01021144.1.p1  ORF type:complete len:279 (+),score=58.32 GHVL01021144.1:582-1418(+)